MADDTPKIFFFIELRTGCIIIAYLNLALFISVVISVRPKDDSTTLGVTLPVEIIIKIVSVGVFLMFTVILLVGVHQYKAGWVRVYMVFNVFVLLLSVAIFCANILYLGATYYKFFTNLPFVLLNYDFCRVVSDYYLHLTAPFTPPSNKVQKEIAKETSALLERAFLQNST